MSSNNINIYGVLHNDTEYGIIATADQINDSSLKKSQATINSDVSTSLSKKLESGSLKTINGQSLVGSGNITAVGPKGNDGPKGDKGESGFSIRANVSSSNFSEGQNRHFSDFSPKNSVRGLQVGEIVVDKNGSLWQIKSITADGSAATGGGTCQLTPIGVSIQGPKGQNGTNGTDGKNGTNGTNGLKICVWDGNNYGTGITPINNDLVISKNTWNLIRYNGSNLNTSTVLGNIKGKDGKDGSTPTVSISDSNTWIINGTDTKKPAKGTDGSDGATGPKGSRGYSSRFTTNTGLVDVPLSDIKPNTDLQNGDLVLTSNGALIQIESINWTKSTATFKNLGISLKGPQGEKGSNGSNGSKGDKGANGFSIRSTVNGNQTKVPFSDLTPNDNIQKGDLVIVKGNALVQIESVDLLGSTVNFKALGVSLQGKQGNTGAQGPTGPTGPTGSQGKRGFSMRSMTATGLTNISISDISPNVDLQVGDLVLQGSGNVCQITSIDTLNTKVNLKTLSINLKGPQGNSGANLTWKEL